MMTLPTVISGLSPDMISFATSFVFVFAVVFALLVYSGVFGRKEERAPKGPLMAIAAVIALVTSFYQPFTVFLQQFMPIASMLLIVIFFLVFIQQLIKREGKGDPWPAMIGMGTLLLVLGVIWPSLWGYLNVPGMSSETMLWGVGIIIILLIFFLAYSAKSGEKT